ncbi:MAG: hypothetical protein KAH77_00360 [Thiomargarita sp.]|nr:hypothetical protein [Thiomargarita sp.]
MFEPLDDYEKELMEDIEKGEFTSIDNLEKEKEPYSQYAKYTTEEIEIKVYI